MLQFLNTHTYIENRNSIGTNNKIEIKEIHYSFMVNPLEE